MKILVLFLFFVIATECNNNESKDINRARSLEPISQGEVILHHYFSLAYSEKDEQAFWVFYFLSPYQINGTYERTNDFREDSLVGDGSASLEDYRGSGYDRGHLCPAADMKLNQIAMSETFLLSNMSPQIAGFNRGVWKRLEEQVRKWALEYNGLYVVAGGVLESGIDTIGVNNVVVPSSYYKVLYSEKNGMVGFLLRHESSSEPLYKFAVPVDSIENLTGIDFYHGLDDELEKRLESELNILNWFPN